MRGDAVGTFFGSLFDGISIHSPRMRGDEELRGL